MALRRPHARGGLPLPARDAESFGGAGHLYGEKKFPRSFDLSQLADFCTLNQERFLQIRLRRRALVTTETELMAIAAAANIGFSRMPKKG